MIRHNALTLTAFLVASQFACDKPGVAEMQREQQANEQLAQAKNEAAQRTQVAQAEADKDIAAARAEFEKNRQDYVQARTADLADLDNRVAALEAKEKKAKDKAKVELQADLREIRAQRDAFARDMNALSSTTAAAWDQAKAKLEREWNALKAAVDKAQ